MCVFFFRHFRKDARQVHACFPLSSRITTMQHNAVLSVLTLCTVANCLEFDEGLRFNIVVKYHESYFVSLLYTLFTWTLMSLFMFEVQDMLRKIKLLFVSDKLGISR